MKLSYTERSREDLDFSCQWYVGSQLSCSYMFRHLHLFSIELGFSKPEGWYPEEQDALDAAKELYAALDYLLTSG